MRLRYLSRGRSRGDNAEQIAAAHREEVRHAPIIAKRIYSNGRGALVLQRVGAYLRCGVALGFEHCEVGVSLEDFFNEVLRFVGHDELASIREQEEGR